MSERQFIAGPTGRVLNNAERGTGEAAADLMRALLRLEKALEGLGDHIAAEFERNKGPLEAALKNRAADLDFSPLAENEWDRQLDDWNPLKGDS